MPGKRWPTLVRMVARAGRPRGAAWGRRTQRRGADAGNSVDAEEGRCTGGANVEEGSPGMAGSGEEWPPGEGGAWTTPAAAPRCTSHRRRVAAIEGRVTASSPSSSRGAGESRLLGSSDGGPAVLIRRSTAARSRGEPATAAEAGAPRTPPAAPGSSAASLDADPVGLRRRIPRLRPWRQRRRREGGRAAVRQRGGEGRARRWQTRPVEGGPCVHGVGRSPDLGAPWPRAGKSRGKADVEGGARRGDTMDGEQELDLGPSVAEQSRRKLGAMGAPNAAWGRGAAGGRGEAGAARRGGGAQEGRGRRARTAAGRGSSGRGWAVAAMRGRSLSGAAAAQVVAAVAVGWRGRSPNLVSYHVE
jgi:hypothetical protein